MGHLNVWLRALEMQQDRALQSASSDEEREVDVTLFAISLGQFVRAVEYCRPLHPHIEGRLQQFHREVPEAVHIRDVLTHFDDYDQGRGREQRAGGKGPADFSPTTWFPGATVELYLGEYDLDVTRALERATDLFNDLLPLVMPRLQEG